MRSNKTKGWRSRSNHKEINEGGRERTTTTLSPSFILEKIRSDSIGSFILARSLSLSHACCVHNSTSLVAPAVFDFHEGARRSSSRRPLVFRSFTGPRYPILPPLFHSSVGRRVVDFIQTKRLHSPVQSSAFTNVLIQ